jgi:CRP-like cAMP-binding protein
MTNSACQDDTRDVISRFSLVARASTHPLHLASPCDTCRAREFSACAPLTAEEQKRVAAIMRTINVQPHCSIFDEADPAEYVYTITAGTVKVYKLLGDGRRQITGFLFAGDFLGLIHNEGSAASPAEGSRLSLSRFPTSSSGSSRWHHMSWRRRKTR